MRRTVVRSPRVGDDLISIYAYVHTHNPTAADRLLDAVESTVRRLSSMPERGRLWPSAEPLLAGMRVVSVPGFRSYLVFYRSTRARVEIYRVVHGARELDHVLGSLDLEGAGDDDND